MHSFNVPLHKRDYTNHGAGSRRPVLGYGSFSRRLVVYALVVLVLCSLISLSCRNDEAPQDGSGGDLASGEGSETEVSQGSGGDDISSGEPSTEIEGGIPDNQGDTSMPDEPVLPLDGAVLAIVENHPASRPQSGLDKADVVYEADVVAGITRFLAVYYTKGSAKIGPVRSVRKFMVEIAQAYDAPLAHAGGNADALKLIKAIKDFKDMNEMSNSGAYFWRDKTRKMPHNLYTSTNFLQKGAKKKGYALPLLSRLPIEETGETGSGSTTTESSGGSQNAGSDSAKGASLIRIPFSKRTDSKNIVEYRFEDGSYRRFINDKAHVMRDGAPISPKNVIVMFVETEDEGGDDPQRINKVVGSGKALFFSSGVIHNGSWKKATPQHHFSFFLENGKSAKFSPGSTWIEIVDRNTAVTYE
jgi:hypothetical protein